MGEEARRSGSDFEHSISEMLTRLGYEVVMENESVKCTIPEHKCKTHGIDFLAKPPSGGFRKPVVSPDGLTLFDCTHAPIGESDLSELQDTQQCLKLVNEYKDLKGAVLVTASWVPRELREKVGVLPELYLWDQARCHLYGNLARYYARFKDLEKESRSNGICSINGSETTVTISLMETRVGYFGIFNYYEVGIFYESDSRFNLDVLRTILRELKKLNAIPRFSLTRVIIHTTRGFTADFTMKINNTLEGFVGPSLGLRCSSSDLYDHSNPWFPSYLR